ncbi:MAG: hypothetical protein ACLUZX_14520 [Subdoligranulum sp.]
MNQTLCAFLCGESQKNAVGGEYDSPAKKREIFAANRKMVCRGTMLASSQMTGFTGYITTSFPA